MSKISLYLAAPYLTALAVLIGAQAQAASVFGLQITPKGEQKLNLATGATTMPQGGTIRDSKTGLVVVAGNIVTQGDSLNASAITLTTKQGGTLKADSLVYLPKQSQVSAKGHLSYSDKRVQGLSAEQMLIDTRTGAVTALGGVQTVRPKASAAQLVALPMTNQLLLSGKAQITAGKVYAADKILFNLVQGKALIAPKAGDLAPFAPYVK